MSSSMGARIASRLAKRYGMIWFVIGAVIVGGAAINTHGFTKKPSWWLSGTEVTSAVLEPSSRS